jgi:hypothetical protein
VSYSQAFGRLRALPGGRLAANFSRATIDGTSFITAARTFTTK